MSETGLAAEAVKAKIKYEMLVEQLSALQAQVADAKRAMEDAERKARGGPTTEPSKDNGKKMVELEDDDAFYGGDDDLDYDALTAVPAFKTSAPPTAKPKEPPKPVPAAAKRPSEPIQESQKDRAKRQRMEQLHSFLPPEVDLKNKASAKAGPVRQPPSTISVIQSNGDSRRSSFPKSFQPSTNDRKPSFSTGQRLQNIPAPRLPQPPTPDENIDTDPHSNLRLLSRLVPAPEMDTHMSSRRSVKLHEILRTMQSEFGDIDGDWVTFGVVASKTMPRTASNDKKYCVLRLNDLNGTQVNLFLFDAAFEAHYKESTGTVVAVLNPSIARPQDSTDPIGISIDNPDKYLRIGVSRDLAICKAIKKDGNPCTSAVDAREGAYCGYHVESNFRNFKNKRQEFATGTGEVTVGPPKPQINPYHHTANTVVKTQHRSAQPETEATPTYNFGGGRQITLGEKKVVDKRKPSQETEEKINEEIAKRLKGDKSAGSKHLRLARGIAGIEDLKQEANTTTTSAAFSESLIRKIGYDPRESMDAQGRRLASKVSSKPSRTSPIKQVAPVEDDGRPVLAKGESPKKKIILFDDDEE